MSQTLVFSSAYLDQRPFQEAMAWCFFLLLSSCTCQVCSVCLGGSTHITPLFLTPFFPATSLLKLTHPAGAVWGSKGESGAQSPLWKCIMHCSNHF